MCWCGYPRITTLKCWILIGVLAALVGVCPHVQARNNLTVGDFLNVAKNVSNDNNKLKPMIAAAGEAYGWANGELQDQGTKPFYCPPPNLGITQDQYFDILFRFVEKNPRLRSNDFQS